MTINSILGLVLLISLYQINLSKMKTAIIIPIILIHFSCYSQTTKEKYILDDVGIMVENFEKSNQDDDKYSKDNKIYTIGKKFYYTTSLFAGVFQTRCPFFRVLDEFILLNS